MQELRQDQDDNSLSIVPSEKDMKAFVEKVKDDILLSIENSTPEEIEKYRATLSPEALEFFDSKEADKTAAQMRHFAIFTVLDRLTPEEIKWVKEGVGEEYSSILHDLKNAIHIHQLHQSIKAIVERKVKTGTENH